MDIFLFKKYYIIFVFFLSFIISQPLNDEQNSINFISTEIFNNTYKSYSDNDKDDGFFDMIKDHLLVSIFIIVGIVVFIILIVFTIVCSIKLRNKHKNIREQISKVSFKSDNPSCSNSIDEDDLLV